MNQDTGKVGDPAGFDVLEEKVLRAVALIQRLREERAGLIEARASLEARLAGVSSPSRREADGSQASDASVRDLTGRLAELEKERSQWVREKRDLTRRVEDIVAKLEFLEAESAPHA